MLAICPTRARAKKTKVMLESFIKNTSYNTELIFVFDRDDEQIEQYERLFSDNRIFYIVQARMTITQIFNKVFSLYPSFKFYHLTNDDFIYRTFFWDEKLMSAIEENGGYGIAYGDDKFPNHKLPTAPVISGNIARALGWLQLPTLTHLYGDCVWELIGQKIKRLFFIEEVVIKHNHFLVKISEDDEIYKKTNSPEMYKKDMDAFKQWIGNGYLEDVKKIQEAINGLKHNIAEHPGG